MAPATKLQLEVEAAPFVLSDERLYQEESLQVALWSLSLLSPAQLSVLQEKIRTVSPRVRSESAVQGLESLFHGHDPSFRLVFTSLQGLLAERLGELDD